MSIVYSDRSRTLTRQRCPRRKWFEYDCPTDGPVNGVVPVRLDVDLVGGSGFHAGSEALLKGTGADEAVGRALEGYGDWPGIWPLAKSRGLILGEKEDAHYAAWELASWVEALIRGYHKLALPQLLGRFDVVEVERDGTEDFVDGDLTVRWGYRADALLMEKGTLDLYILSLKTAKEYGRREEDSAHHDMQGLSEVAAVDKRLGRWQRWADEINKDALDFGMNDGLCKTYLEKVPYWFNKRLGAEASPTVFGVKMEYALKGRKQESPKGSGQYKYSNPLIRPWKRSGDDLSPRRRNHTHRSGGDYAITWDFQDDLGGNHTLGKGWDRINIWEDMGVKEWIEYVSNETIQGFAPGDAIRNQFVFPMEYFRNEDDIHRWQKRVIFNERRESQGLAETLASIGTPAFEDALDKHFEPRSISCDWPKRCPYQEICYGTNKEYLYNPLSSGLYEIRTANHKGEVEE